MSDRKHTIMFLAADYDGDGTVRTALNSLSLKNDERSIRYRPRI